MSDWAITDVAHDDCDECRNEAESAAILARATGSRGSTHSTERYVDNLLVVHSATVQRIVNVIQLADRGIQ